MNREAPPLVGRRQRVTAGVLFASLLLLAPLGTGAAVAQDAALVKRLTENFARILNEGNLDLVESTFDPMLRMRSPVLPQPIVGVENFRGFVTSTRLAFPDLKVEIEDVFFDSNRVVARYTLSGTNLGPLGPLPPTRRSFRLPGVAIVVLEGDKILEWHDYWNALDLYTALGFRLAPPAMTAPPAAENPPR